MFSSYEAMIIILLSAHLVLQLVLLLSVAWLTWRFSRCVGSLRRHIRKICLLGKMDCDEVIDRLLAEQGTCDGVTGETVVATQEHAKHAKEPSQPRESPLQSTLQNNKKHRERLAALVAGGQAKQYLGKSYTVDQIDAISDDEAERLYARYEARLGAAMTKTLGSAALQLYAGVASMFLPIENQPALIADLEGDPFVEHALSSATCELYHRYGMFLAPLTTVLTTLKHTRFGHQCPVRITSNDDGEPTERACERSSYGVTGEPICEGNTQ